MWACYKISNQGRNNMSPRPEGKGSFLRFPINSLALNNYRHTSKVVKNEIFNHINLLGEKVCGSC